MVRNRLVYGLTAAALLTIGCGENPLVNETDEPMLYLVLTLDPLAPFDTIVSAVLGTTGTPVRFTYRSAEVFEMRRTSDGAQFAWLPQVPEESPFDYLPSGGNYALAGSSSAAGLGRGDLAIGETYTLTISTNGRLVSGRTTIPGRPAPVIVERDGMTVIEWPRVPGAAGYLFSGTPSVDTFFVLGATGSQLPNSLRVSAVDTNWFRYMTDSKQTAAGIWGGYGLFGAMSTATVQSSAGARGAR